LSVEGLSQRNFEWAVFDSPPARGGVGMFPKALGVLLVVGGVGYLLDVVAGFLIPDLGEKISAFLVVPASTGELWMVGYLLVRGVKSSHLTDRSPVAA
jgi:hypothetical protein